MLIFILLFNFNLCSTPALNKNVLEENIESKRKLMLSAGITSMLTDRLSHTNNSSPKNGYTLGVGFELLRDKLSWDFFYSYVPKSRYNEYITTSINDFGFDLKGMQAFSRYYSLFGTLGILSRQEAKDYTSYSMGFGVDFNVNSFFSISIGISFKSSFKQFEENTSAASRGSNMFIRNSFYI